MDHGAPQSRSLFSSANVLTIFPIPVRPPTQPILRLRVPRIQSLHEHTSRLENPVNIADIITKIVFVQVFIK
jgi:hypothetical protein